jgi:exonuclease I
VESLTRKFAQLERRVKITLREVERDRLNKAEKAQFDKIKLALIQLKLDIRDYEYAETRAEQVKWGKIARHNLKALEQGVLALGTVFGAADTAELGAQIDTVRNELT